MKAETGTARRVAAAFVSCTRALVVARCGSSAVGATQPSTPVSPAPPLICGHTPQPFAVHHVAAAEAASRARSAWPGASTVVGVRTMHVADVEPSGACGNDAAGAAWAVAVRGRFVHPCPAPPGFQPSSSCVPDAGTAVLLVDYASGTPIKAVLPAPVGFLSPAAGR